MTAVTHMPDNAPMRSRQLTYFLAVVEHGGFGRAAAALQVAQPTLSQSVKALERELGAELFHRATYGVVLTAAGKALLGPARQLARDVNAVRRSVGRFDTVVLDLIAAAPLGVYPGAALVGSFCRAHPEIMIQLDRPDTDDQLAATVRDGASELGLSYLPIQRLGLVEVELGHHELMLATPPGWDRPTGTDRPGAPVTLPDLAGMDLIGPPRGCAPRDVVEAGLRAGGVRTRLAMELGQRDTILELVAAGIGATVLTDASRPAAKQRGIELHPFDPPMRVPFGLVHRPGSLSEAAASFIDHARPA